MATLSNSSISLEQITKFAIRKGFVYPGSEIYGGLANTWDFGPKGTLLKNNIKEAWRKFFVLERTDMFELDCGIFMNSKVWEASGHTAGFSDCLVDDKKSKHRFRADHLIEEQLGIDVEGLSADEISQIIHKNNLKNPITGQPGDWTEARYMNLMFETNRDKLTNSISILNELLETEKLPQKKDLEIKLEKQESGRIYLRPETAQGIFVQFKNVLQSERPKLPFGIAQIGKAFRNEITPRNFIFRVIELEQMEIEYFIPQPENELEWNNYFEKFLIAQKTFLQDRIGLLPENLNLKEHSKEKLSHYSKRTVDIEFNFPFGFSELTGLAYRTDFDLKQHAKYSGQDLTYTDPKDQKNKFIPHTLEPTVGLERLFLAALCQHYTEEKIVDENGKEDLRVVLKLPFSLAPFKVAILPLMKKDGLSEHAFEIYQNLRKAGFSADYDDSGSIGKRYRRQDENGTPFCLTVDYDSLKEKKYTIRDRDSMTQERLGIEVFLEKISKL